MYWTSSVVAGFGLLLCSAVSATHIQGRTILQNGQVRITNFPNTTVDRSAFSFETYPADASELSYKGRWDSKKTSWWSAAGLKFGYTGKTVAVTFGSQTTPGTLVGFRVSGQDWKFTNVTAGGTHLLASPETDPNANYPVNPATLELRVSNWGYGIQISQVHVASGEKLVKIPDFGRTVEFIGDSLAAGMYTSYEGLSSFAYATGAGLGNTEYSITAQPGICVTDQDCWGNPRGQSHQWFYTSEANWRAAQMWGDNPEPWNFSQHTPADLVIINIGTNDANKANKVDPQAYVHAYQKLIGGVHGVWPNAQVVIMSLWQGFYQTGNSYAQNTQLTQEVLDVYKFFNTEEYLARPIIWNAVTNQTTTLNTPTKPFVHYFNTTGILQHNDIGPQWHPTDMGAAKVAAHLIRYINIKFGWDLYATGPEVLHETTYWNDEPAY